MNFKETITLTSDDQTLINLIYIQKGLDPSISWA
jgi:hypothetical protein